MASWNIIVGISFSFLKQKKGLGLNCNTLKTRKIPLVNMCWNYINCYYFILCDPENLEEVIENKKD